MSPTARRAHKERHFSHRAGWLRAMVLGANDGIVSTACLLLGVAAAEQGLDALIVAGLAGLVAGALSMAVGELVSVSSQRDSERNDIARERAELAEMPERELEELVGIQRAKGLSPRLAREVAIELTAHDALAAHVSEELGITDTTRARPVQAALSSAAAFALGAALPLVAIIIAPAAARVAVTIGVAIAALASLGALGAWLGGAPWPRPVVRVVLGGGAAMGITMGIGAIVGQSLA